MIHVCRNHPCCKLVSPTYYQYEPWIDQSIDIAIGLHHDKQELGKISLFCNTVTAAA